MLLLFSISCVLYTMFVVSAPSFLPSHAIFHMSAAAKLAASQPFWSELLASTRSSIKLGLKMFGGIYCLTEYVGRPVEVREQTVHPLRLDA